MTPGIKNVLPMEDYNLLLTFLNGEQKIFNMKPYLETGIFADLKDAASFKSVHVSFDTIEWSNGADLCPELLYNEGIIVK